MGECPSNGSRPNATVLLVDDRRTNLVALHMALEPSGYRFVLANDGASALEVCDTGTIDLVVLDVFMPKMDGVEVAERLRSRERTRSLPIVFLTGLPAEVKRRFLGWAAHDVAIEVKPFDPAHLAATMDKLLGRRLRGGAAPPKTMATAG